MVTILLAFVIGLAVFLLIWRSVTKAAISVWGGDAAMTFTPTSYKPALDPNGTLLASKDFLIEIEAVAILE